MKRIKFILSVMILVSVFASCSEKGSNKTEISQIAEDDLSENYSSGELIYSQKCKVCHQADGKGNSVFPSLHGSSLLKDKQNAVKTVKFGRGNMPPFPDFSNQQIADVLNYVMNSWGNKLGKITADEVKIVTENK